MAWISIKRKLRLSQAERVSIVNAHVYRTNGLRRRIDGEQKPPVAMATFAMDEDLSYSAAVEQPTAGAIEEEQDEEQYEEPAPGELLPPPDFKPFFTLVEDPETGEHIHPTVHYVFADDDPEILTSAALDALEVAENDEATRTTPAEVRERYVIVDLAADAKSVAATSSMSADWQAVKIALTQAPSWGEDPNNSERGLMLKISGQDSKATSEYKRNNRRHGHSARLDELAQEFNQRLENLDKLLERTQNASNDE